MSEPTGALHAVSPEAAVAALASDPARGLSAEEASRRLAEVGPNELEEKPRASFLALLLDQFKNFLVIILIAAAVVSMALGEWVDAGAILLIVILNAIIGVVQESKAEEALAALKRLSAPDAKVIRGGRTFSVPSRELVPGDTVLLEAGNRVPADMRLVETVNLRVEEASLTGESLPVEKRADASLPADAQLGDRCTMAWMGTMVAFGRGRGIVSATAMRTQIGLIATMIQEEEREDTPLQKKLTQMGKWLGIAALAICAVVFLVGILKGQPILMMFMTGVSLAIAAVPEGLPAVVTICLALGMQEMLRRHALIRKLPAVETLGSATVICTDKTGTLTQNKMTVGNLRADGELFAITGEGYQPVGEVRRNDRRAELRECRAVRLSLQAAMLASDARLEPEPAASGEGRWRMVGDPTEGALVVAAAKADLHRERVEALYPRVAEVPFDSDRKRMSTIHRVPGSHFAAKDAAALSVETPYVAFVKGAPALALEKGEPGVMDKPPRPPGEPFITRSMVLSLALQSAAVTAVSLFAFWIGRSVFGTVEAARAMAFVALSGCQLVRAYTNRSESASLFSLGVFTNKWMQYAVASSAVLLAAVLYIPGLNKVFDAIPLSARQWAYLAPLLVFPAVVDELTKLARRGARNSRGGSLRGAAA